MLIRGAEVWGHGLADVRIDGERIAAIEPPSSVPPPNPAEIIEANGALLLPGLHDHHIHLAALAAKQASIQCGPPQVTTAAELAAALDAPGQGWLRGVGYHESVMGLPTAEELDRIVARRPLRIQHRSGRLWLLNSLAVAELLDRAPAPPGLDRATGHLFDEDRWLRDTLQSAPPDFTAVGADLARRGITGLTDMSPANDPTMAAHFAAEMDAGRLPQRVLLAGGLALGQAPGGPWRLGPAKLHLHEAALPEFEAAVDFIAAAHAGSRPVAIHCVSEVELVFALAALEQAGVAAGDRSEHASVASDALVERIAGLGLAVCAQPHFVRERGDAYLRDVEPRYHRELYRLRAFVEAGVALSGGSDAPFGSADPWAAMAAAVERATEAGTPFGRGEALTPEEALGLFLADSVELGRARTIAPGAPADLCLLDRNWGSARSDLGAVKVRATWVSGRLVHNGVDQAPV